MVINFSEYFKSTRKNLYSKVGEEPNLRKESIYIFVTTPDEEEKNVEILQPCSSDKSINCFYTEILNLLDPELQLINTKPTIKNKLKELLSELKKFKVQTILFLEFKKRNNSKIFHSSIKIFPSDSDIDEACISMQIKCYKKL